MGNKRKIIKSGDCMALDRLDPWRDKSGDDPEKWMRFTLTDDGVLTISGNASLPAVPAAEAHPLADEPLGPIEGWSENVSQFKDLDFHTVIIEEGVRVLEEECLKDCKNFRKIVLPEKMPVIRKNFAGGSQLEYTEKDGLLFLGPASNSLYYLMGCKDDFDKEKLIIPEGVVFIADEAFKGKVCIKEAVFPSTLEFAGWWTFDGTSIKDVFIPEGKLANDETLLAFEGWDIRLESISVPYNMYREYKEGNDHGWVESHNTTAKIIFRNPDGSIAEILEPQPIEYDCHSDSENDNNSIDKNSDELPF